MILFFINQGKPFFLQQRPGKNKETFSIIKFKTMNEKKDANGDLLLPLQRLTRIGEFMRKYSLDEIPQFLNVIKGDMSIIGPRPLLIEYLPLYNDYQKQRHIVKPGITGWAQVNGRNPVSRKQKLDYYISFLFDLKIFAMTIFKVLIRKDVFAENNSIMPEFKGYSK